MSSKRQYVQTRWVAERVEEVERRKMQNAEVFIGFGKQLGGLANGVAKAGWGAEGQFKCVLHKGL